MSVSVVLAEKPSVARELARVLQATQKKNGSIEGNGYIVTWALGHLIELAAPQEYEKNWESWHMEDLPMLPKHMKLSIIKQTAHQYRNVKAILQRKDIKQVIIATDAGREGELVARWILEKAGYHGTLKRLWISSQTDHAIQEGFAHLKDAKAYEPLYHSARCRAQADWLIGLNVTRALTCKYQAQLSAGRVQTPTLAMIVAREQEIRNFKPKAYSRITIQLDGFTMQYHNQKNGSDIFDEQEAAQVKAAIKGKSVYITAIKKNERREKPPKLYDLTALQQDANRRYGYSAKQTLDIMQDLYEIHKLLTYPRTDSCYLSQDIVPTLIHRLKAIAIGEYAPFVEQVMADGIHTSKHFVDDTKVSDHHAIIPTEEYVELAKLDLHERRIYDLVIRRFLAVLSKESIYEDTRIEGICDQYHFHARGHLMKQSGWRALQKGIEDIQEDGEPEQTLPHVVKGQTWKILAYKEHQLQTKSAPRYNEATLLAAMEHPEKFIQNEKMKGILKESGGIGTVATRADIIEKLFAAHYIEKRGKEIYPLSKGIQLIDLVPEELKSPLLTAQWEERLKKISLNQEKEQDFLNAMRNYATELVKAVNMSDATYRHDNMTRKCCPLCEQFLLEVNGKKGKLLVCSNPNCKYKQTLSYLSNARCPNCHKKLTIVGEKDKKLYTCHCGFREKFDRFNETLKAKSKKANRQELHNYMKKQEQEQKQEKSAFQLALEAAQAKAKSENSNE